MRTLLALLSLVLAATQAGAGTISYRDLLSRPRAKPTEVVHYGPAKHQLAELWLPKGQGPFPTIILIHGGCWLAELPGTELMAYMAADLRATGYAVWSIDYRRVGEAGGGYPGTYQDTSMAIDKLRAIAAAKGLDLSHVVAVGHSAGAQLALWAAARPKVAKESPIGSADPLPVAGVVSLAGIDDLKAYRADGPPACGGPATIDAIAGASRGGDPYMDTSPAALAPLGVPQAVISGALDPIVPPQFGWDYAMTAAGAGDHVRQLTIEDAGHFELIDPTSAAWAKVRLEIDILTGRTAAPKLPEPYHPHD
ncbi:MAG: alpha/beta fold hydrolase [Alphaproteobacteria bacterium]|nr:alpha/beta fold hydrolase [Alphaproteobacteria bacterium]